MQSIEGKHIHEVKMADKIKKNSNKKEDEEKKKLKGQEKKENRKYLHLFFNPFDHYVVLRSSFWY